MTNTESFIHPLPDDDTCLELMTDAIRDATAEIADSLPYFRNRFDMISDYDDYIPAAARMLTAITDRFLAHIDASPRDALYAIINNLDFLHDASTADFSTPLFDYIDIDAFLESDAF